MSLKTITVTEGDKIKIKSITRKHDMLIAEKSILVSSSGDD